MAVTRDTRDSDLLEIEMAFKKNNHRTILSQHAALAKTFAKIDEMKMGMIKSAEGAIALALDVRRECRKAGTPPVEFPHLKEIRKRLRQLRAM